MKHFIHKEVKKFIELLLLKVFTSLALGAQADGPHNCNLTDAGINLGLIISLRK